jgi:3-oxoacyl-[acyl-carrier protein] reductase
MWPKRANDDFSRQVALITGGSRGIGFATAQAFLERGAYVAICAKDPERLAAAARQLSQCGAVEAVLADVRDRQQVEWFISKVHDRFGRIDILVNNAGLASTGDFVSQEAAHIDEIIDVNIKGVLYTTHAVLPIMLAQKQGVIINVSSGAGLSGFAGLVTYCTSKFGIVGFTESLDQEVRHQEIRVYGICPGRVATDMQQQVSGRKLGMPPEKVAGKILQLAGPQPPIATGQCLTIAF